MAGDISVTEDMTPGIEYETELGALEIIETYKKKLYYKKMKEVKNITYKYCYIINFYYICMISFKTKKQWS